MSASPTQISPTFHAAIEKLSTDSLASGNATIQAAQRTWMGPPGAVNPLAVSTLETGLTRGDLNSQYDETLTSDKKTLADRMGAKMQIDYLAAAERAYRARHATTVRCAYHAASRSAGQGSQAGVYRTVREYLQTLIASGAQS